MMARGDCVGDAGYQPRSGFVGGTGVNRVAVAGISPGLSVSETPGLGVAGGIIHIYRVAVAAKQPMDCGETTNGGAAKQPTGVWRNDQRDCGKRPTDVRQTTNGFAAKQPTGTWQNNQRGRGKTTNGGVAKQPTGLRRNERRVCGETTNGGAIRMGYYRCG